MLDLTKPISQYTDADIEEAARFIKSLPKSKQRAVIDKLITQIRTNRSNISRAQLNNLFEFKGIIYSGDMTGGR